MGWFAGLFWFIWVYMGSSMVSIGLRFIEDINLHMLWALETDISGMMGWYRRITIFQ